MTFSYFQVTGHVRKQNAISKQIESKTEVQTISPCFLEPTGVSSEMDFSRICKQEGDDEDDDVPPLEACDD